MADELSRLLRVREIEEYLFHEARLLDERRFEDWMDLFTEDGVYWVPAEEGQDNPIDTVSIFYDTRQLMEVRIRRLRHPANYAQRPPSRTRHLVTNVTVDSAGSDGGDIEAASNLLMAEYRDDDQRVFAASVRHRLRREPAGLRIAMKRVDLINCDAAHGPMSIPF